MTYQDFPQIKDSEIVGISANLLTEQHRLAVQGNDGNFYAVPLFELARHAGRGTVSFRTRWAGGETRLANDTDRIEVVRS